MTVQSVAMQLEIWDRFVEVVRERISCEEARELESIVSRIPVLASRATRRLGSYSAKGSHPICIRLQFSQESDLLTETFFHELAHACHHLTSSRRDRVRLGHGPEWRSWAKAFGISVSARGKSDALGEIYRSRLKVVAVCRKCGVTFRRQRRLDSGKKYVHPGCGGEVVPTHG